jgi:hypothetical protein
MKVIAINDAPIPRSHPYYHNGVYYERAYHKGDVFEIYDGSMFRTEDYLIIYHDKLEITMDVDPKNFITLIEHRENKLNELGI